MHPPPGLYVSWSKPAGSGVVRNDNASVTNPVGDVPRGCPAEATAQVFLELGPTAD